MPPSAVAKVIYKCASLKGLFFDDFVPLDAHDGCPDGYPDGSKG